MLVDDYFRFEAVANNVAVSWSEHFSKKCLNCLKRISKSSSKPIVCPVGELIVYKIDSKQTRGPQQKICDKRRCLSLNALLCLSPITNVIMYAHICMYVCGYLSNLFSLYWYFRPMVKSTISCPNKSMFCVYTPYRFSVLITVINTFVPLWSSSSTAQLVPPNGTTVAGVHKIPFSLFLVSIRLSCNASAVE